MRSIELNARGPSACANASQAHADGEESKASSITFSELHHMFIERNDFRIRAENFDLSDGHNLVRIVCGAFMFPHVAGKFVAGGLSAGTVGFFAKAGFQPPELWVLLAAMAELSTGVALVLGLCTRWAALGAAGVMAFAVYALQMVKGFGWTWNTGGYEYPVFWGLCALGVALTEFNRRAAAKQGSGGFELRTARPAH
jgi:putative oxidoreductase